MSLGLASLNLHPLPLPIRLTKTYAIEECIGPRPYIDLSGKYGSSSQLEYMSSICKATLTLSEDLPYMTFDDLLIETGKKRQDIAKIAKSEHASKFGKLRTDKYTDKISTPLLEQYKPMLEELEKIPRDCPSMSWESYTEEATSSFKTGFRTGKTYKGETVNLSRYLLYGAKHSTIAHTYPENLPAVKKQCSYLFNEIMRLDETSHKEDIQVLIAQLHWWLAHGVLYFRGSAACAEMMVAAITLHKFGTITPYKVGIYSDHLAIVSSLEDFTSIYPSLRES